jgi:hypothetical protein
VVIPSRQARNDALLMTLRFHLTLLAAVAALACDGRSAIRDAEASAPDSATLARRAEAERARQDSIVRARPGYIIDSILPVEEEIRRFQATIPVRPHAFSSAARSRSDLVTEFVRALERNDTTALRRLVVDRAEFGYLIYPTSPNAGPPYRQSPDLVWLSRSASTDKALSRLFARFGGKRLRYAGFTCPGSSDRQGANALWSGCVVERVESAGATTRLRMFGPIIAREGRFKFLSLTNGL